MLNIFNQFEKEKKNMLTRDMWSLTAALMRAQGSAREGQTTALARAMYEKDTLTRAATANLVLCNLAELYPMFIWLGCLVEFIL